MTGRRRVAGALLGTLVAGGLAGCGAQAPGTGSAPRPGVAAAALFSRDCAVCHSLTAPARRTQQGGELGAAHLSLAEIRQLTAEMPRLHGPLSATEVAVLARYVFRAQRR